MLSMVMLTVCLGQAADIAMGHRASAEEKLYRVIDGKADAKTLNGFRRYHAGCNHCHGANGEGSTFAGSLVADLPTLDVFLQVVREGRTSGGNSVMDGFGDNPNFSPICSTSTPICRRERTACSNAAVRRGWTPDRQPGHAPQSRLPVSSMIR